MSKYSIKTISGESIELENEEPLVFTFVTGTFTWTDDEGVEHSHEFAVQKAELIIGER